MIKSILAVIAGFGSMVAVVIVCTVLATALLLGDVEPKPGQVVPMPYLIVNLTYGLLAALLGGYVCAWLAPRRAGIHVGVLTAVVVLMSLATILGEGPAPGQPDWYPLVLGLIGVTGVPLGGVLRMRGIVRARSLDS